MDLGQRARDWVDTRVRQDAKNARGLLQYSGQQVSACLDDWMRYWSQRQFGPMRRHRMTHRAFTGVDPFEGARTPHA